MSKHKKNHKSNKKSQLDKKHLDFEKAKTMTVEQAVRQDKQLKAGITESDSVLDRYIKQHREEIGARKFDTQSVTLDTKTLDDFIQKQRETVEEAEFLDDIEDSQDRSPVMTEVSSDPIKQLEQEEVDSVLLAQSDLPSASAKKRGFLILGVAVLTALVFAGGYWLSHRVPKTQLSQNVVKSDKAKKDSLPKANEESKKVFDDLYASFFLDEAKTQLKNEQLDKLPDLEVALKALEGTSDYDTAKAHVDRLSKQVSALNKINAQFTSPVIVDGAKVDSQVNDIANFDQLGAEVLNTGNPSLDSLIQTAISDGRQQQVRKVEEAVVAQQAQAQEAAQVAATQAAAAAPAIPAVDTSGVQYGLEVQPQSPVLPSPSVMTYGITNYDPAILQRHLSRVPYNHDVIADVNNPAWIFGEGVLESILETSRKRGYIVGNDFILERVNIIKGNGYYNMFKPDGTYLFSINAKTGYFVGNGKGYAEALDY